MYKYCPNCGEKLPTDAHFCPNCGHELPHTTRSSKTQATEASRTKRSHSHAAIVSNAYNGSGNPGLIRSTKLWLKTVFHANQCMGRADYWWGYLGLTIIGLIISLIYDISLPANVYYPSTLTFIMAIIFFTYTLLFAVLNIFATVQRLHDAGHSGYNWLWCLTGIGVIYVLILIVQPTNWNYTTFPRNNYQI
ncbi:DUF805 domain-containing protein [Limosilactobacillus reuteri]|uniref:DUF805 domain-containing protein n=1 Tax=Limosilactobacillus reuteri TaxID=1598 RepID=UPI000B327CD3|nr:DUF805 domain-containing protein [Limosilactobacillus reuteri]WJK30321.1 DUF805 domain-containing protein [Limosilactobacillus reuteri]